MTSERSVLLVEDEPLIAMMLEDFIETLGHSLAGSCDTVEDALAAVAAGGFDLAILDVHLRGGEPCWPIADALEERGIPFVLATGGHVADPPARHAGVRTLSKPFTMAGVQSVLDDVDAG
ncbi:response regulator [Sphingomonas sp. 1P06PA]|uniref:response regulator n=1 Tax=Sphingomonas sp. 1P06PA TaxID=554121 RepID=UPI0039A754AB